MDLEKVIFSKENYNLIKLNVLKNRIKDYDLIKNAGKYYVDETSEIVNHLNMIGKKALLGIQNKKKGRYTIIGEQYVYYLTSSGKNGEILRKEFTNELHENACRIGKGYLKLKFLFKNIILSNNDKVWLHNANTMFSLWNIILWLEKEERRRVSTRAGYDK